jgi:hypothetical protein
MCRSFKKNLRKVPTFYNHRVVYIIADVITNCNHLPNLGLSVMIPLTDPYVNKSIIKDRPLNLQLFFRWRIKRPDDE